MRLTRRDQLILLTPLGILLLGWFVGPALLGLLATFTTYSPFVTSSRVVGLANYSAVLHDPQFATATANVAVFTLFAVPLELALGLMIASLLRRPLRGKAVWRVLLLLPWLVSPIASGVMWHYLLSSTNGMVDYFLGWLGWPPTASPLGDARLALAVLIGVEVWRVGPFVAFLLLPGLAAIPDEQWEEARLAGASAIRQVVRVAVPGTQQLLLTVSMLLVGLALGSFDTILILTGGGPGTATLTPALYSYHSAFATNDWPVGAAAAWLIAATVFGVGLIYLWLSRQRHGE